MSYIWTQQKRCAGFIHQTTKTLHQPYQGKYAGTRCTNDDAKNQIVYSESNYSAGQETHSLSWLNGKKYSLQFSFQPGNISFPH